MYQERGLTDISKYQPATPLPLCSGTLSTMHTDSRPGALQGSLVLLAMGRVESRVMVEVFGGLVLSPFWKGGRVRAPACNNRKQLELMTA